MKRLFYFSFIAISLLFLGSCVQILASMYGIKILKAFNQEKCELFLKKINFQNIPNSRYYIDTTEYICRFSSRDSIDKKKLFQPIQILYFCGDSLVSYHANCFAKGSMSGSLDWNVFGRFNDFVPASAVKLDSFHLSLSQELQCLNIKNVAPEKKYKVFIYWTLMFEKQAKSAIETVIKNTAEHNKVNDLEIYLINTDKYFIVETK